MRNPDELALRAEVAALRAEVAILRAELAAWRAEQAPRTTGADIIPIGPADFLSMREASEKLSVSRNWLYQLAYSGQLETVKVGRRRLIPAAAIKALISRGLPSS